MKKLLLLAIATLTAHLASAASYDFLTLKLNDGTEQSMKVEGLTLTFTDSQLQAANGEDSMVFDLAMLSTMFFSNTASGIDNALSAPAATLRLNGRTLQVEAPAGANVIIANVGGMLIDHYTAGSYAQTTNLRPGIYIVRINDRSTKINVR